MINEHTSKQRNHETFSIENMLFYKINANQHDNIHDFTIFSDRLPSLFTLATLLFESKIV